MFDSIREPEQITSCPEDNKKLAFADMLAHIAYLKTIPCPSFNSKHRIHFYKKLVIIDEQEFFTIPNRN